MKHSLVERCLHFVLVFALLCTACLPLITSVSAAAITSTVNLSLPRKNMRGTGYFWDNINDVLTLTNLNIDTTDDYGLKVTDGATVVLEGKNYIKASKAALACQGSVTFKGSGSLILESEDMGIYFYSGDDSTTARFLDGKIEITAGGNGIYSPSTALSFAGTTVKIDAPNADANAISSHACKLFGGKVTANNTIFAVFALEVRDIDLTVTAQKPALVSNQKLAITDVAIKAGSSADALSAVEEYADENCIVMKADAYLLGASIIFGASVPAFVDVLLVVGLLALLVAAIVIPYLRHRKKAQAVLAAAEAMINDAPKKNARR